MNTIKDNQIVSNTAVQVLLLDLFEEFSTSASQRDSALAIELQFPELFKRKK